MIIGLASGLTVLHPEKGINNAQIRKSFFMCISYHMYRKSQEKRKSNDQLSKMSGLPLLSMKWLRMKMISRDWDDEDDWDEDEDEDD